MTFKRKDRIYHDGDVWECIVCDEHLAVFALFSLAIDKDGDVHDKVDYTETFIVNNDGNEYGFEYTLINKIQS